MNANQRRQSREEAMAIKAEVDYQRLVSLNSLNFSSLVAVFLLPLLFLCNRRAN